ncbi:MAG: Flp pilus assembly protein CpaB [Friedmanniella sp.]
MKRRLVAAVTAVVLAALGGLVLLSYVGAADERAMADLQPSPVLVATQAIAEGVSGNDLTSSVELRQLPGVAVAPGSAHSLAELKGLVTTTALQPGEQLLLSRFADPVALAATKGVVVPKGLHQVSVLLEPQRVMGGAVKPGATVGVFVSTKNPDSTQLGLHKVLVTAVKGAVAADSGEAPAQPTAMTVTLALSGPAAQKVVFAAEHGSIWLSSEPADAPTGKVPVMTEKSLYS